MDWPYTSFTIGQGVLGLLLLLFPVPFLSYSASQQRWLTAGSPGLVGTALFIAFSGMSGTTSHQSPKFIAYLPIAGLLLVVALIPASVRALRNKWIGLLHILTVAGALLTWLVAAMAISHDWL